MPMKNTATTRCRTGIADQFSAMNMPTKTARGSQQIETVPGDEILHRRGTCCLHCAIRLSFAQASVCAPSTISDVPLT